MGRFARCVRRVGELLVRLSAPAPKTALHQQLAYARSRRRNFAKGERQGAAKLTREKVDAIRVRYATGDVSQKELAYEYGVNQTTIGRAVRGVSYQVGRMEGRDG